MDSPFAGQIQLIVGPMFAGKSSGAPSYPMGSDAMGLMCFLAVGPELLRRIRRYSVSKHRCLVLKVFFLSPPLPLASLLPMSDPALAVTVQQRRSVLR